MNIYSVDIKIAGTAYIKADNEEEALKIARDMNMDGLELPSFVDTSSEVPICGYRFDDPNLPDVSLSPAMTLYGPWEGDIVELVHKGT